MKSFDHQQLMNVLNKLATAEKWAKMPKKKGILVKREITKSGNIKLVLKTKKSEERVYVLKKNKNLYTTAQELAGGDTVGVSLRRYLGKMYCTRLVKSAEMEKNKKENESHNHFSHHYLLISLLFSCRYGQL